VQQVVGADLQRLDLCQQLHVLHLVVWHDLEAVLVMIPADTEQGLLSPEGHVSLTEGVTGHYQVSAQVFYP